MPLALLLRAAPYLVGAILIGLLGTYIHHKGYAAGHDKVQAEFDTYKLKSEQELAEANSGARKKEQQHMDDIAAIDQKYLRSLENVKAENDKIIASLKSGTLSVRNNRTAVCAAIPAGQASASASVDNGASTSQLSESGAEFLLRLGGEADKVVVQLTACQAILEEDRR